MTYCQLHDNWKQGQMMKMMMKKKRVTKKKKEEKKKKRKKKGKGKKTWMNQEGLGSLSVRQ